MSRGGKKFLEMLGYLGSHSACTNSSDGDHVFMTKKNQGLSTEFPQYSRLVETEPGASSLPLSHIVYSHGMSQNVSLCHRFI